MNKHNIFWIVVLMMIATNSWSYGSSSSSKACAKPKFSEYLPVENSEVAVGSNFSFNASANTHPNSIKVAVKGLPVKVTVKLKNAGNYEVSGVIPRELNDTFARISIDAEADSSCNGGGGWLIKINK